MESILFGRIRFRNGAGYSFLIYKSFVTENKNFEINSTHIMANDTSEDIIYESAFSQYILPALISISSSKSDN